MKFPIRTSICMAPVAALVAAAPFLAAAMADQGHTHVAPRSVTEPHKLVQIVRDATTRYLDFNSAIAASYKPTFGCVTGPERGAMGVHFINGALVGDGEIEATKPEALIYEPFGGGYRLVGVEYIVDAAQWMSKHSAPPQLEGQAFQMVGSPNRYGLPAFFELHVWAWRNNPNGAFVDWNTLVTCEGQ